MGFAFIIALFITLVVLVVWMIVSFIQMFGWMRFGQLLLGWTAAAVFWWASYYFGHRYDSDYYRTYAWRPVRTWYGVWVWLEPIDRRRCGWSSFYQEIDYVRPDTGSCTRK